MTKFVFYLKSNPRHVTEPMTRDECSRHIAKLVATDMLKHFMLVPINKFVNVESL